MTKDEIDLERILCKRNFIKFIEDDQLILPKVRIAEYFGISTPTLYRWMRKNGYNSFIGKMRGR